MLGENEQLRSTALLGTEQLISLQDTCRLLDVSVATGRNWVRLGKLQPVAKKKRLFFSLTYVQHLAVSIRRADTRVLKSRRNKKQLRGKAMYRAYLQASPNKEALVRIVKTLRATLSEPQLRLVLTNVALQFCLARQGQAVPRTNLLEQYFAGVLQLGPLERLLQDLVGPYGHQNRLWLRSADLQRVLAERLTYVPGEDTLGFLYLSLRGIGLRKSKGAYYTPDTMVKRLLAAVASCEDVRRGTVFDPCCGTGNFLMQACAYVQSPKQLYGQDLDLLGVQLARINVALLTKVKQVDFLYQQLVCGDTLKKVPRQKFTLIIGNPPWDYEFSVEEKQYLQAHYRTASSPSLESYDLFMERCLGLLATGGYCALVMPEAFLTVHAHQEARTLLVQSCSIRFLSFLGDVFNGVQCPAIILGVQKLQPGRNKGCVVTTAWQKFVVQRERPLNKAFALNSLRLTDAEAACLRKLEGLPQAEYLAGQAVFALGLVTGRNKEVLHSTCQAGMEPVLRGKNIYRYGLMEGRQYLYFQPKQMQQAAPEAVYRAPEKLFYRFIGETLIFTYDDRQRLSLNSCNVLIPRVPGLSVKYVLALLNSRVATYFYRQKFRSLKVLRSYLEQIPLPVAEAGVQRELEALVEQLLAASAASSARDGLLQGADARVTSLRKAQATKLEQLYEELDNRVMQLYGLTQEEQRLIRQSLGQVNLELENCHRKFAD